MGRPIDARGWTFQIKDSAGIFQTIGGLNAFTLNPGENEEVAEISTFESAGHYEQQVMQRGATLELTGFYSEVEDTSTTTVGDYVRDPGQAAAEALAKAVGNASVGQIQFKHADAATYTVWNVTATLGEVGGETNNKTAWGVTFTRTGAPV